MLVLISVLLVEVIFLSFAIIVFRTGIKNELNKYFFSFLISFAALAALNYLSNLIQIGHDGLLIINKILFVAALAAFYILGSFATAITRRQQLPGTALALAITVAVLALTPFVVNDITIGDQAATSVGIQFGALAIVYFLSILALAIFVFFQLGSGARSSDRKVKAYSKNLLVTIGIAIIAMLVTNVLLPTLYNNFDLSTTGLLFGSLIIAGVGYAVVRQGLFDIRSAVVRSVTYTMVLATLTGLYFVAALALSTFFGSTFTSPQQTTSGVLIGLILALVFQPLRHFFDHLTRRIFFQDEYSRNDFFSRLNGTLASTTDLHHLMKIVAKEIGITLKSEQAFFFLYSTKQRPISVGTTGHSVLPKADAQMMDSFVQSHTANVIVASLLETDDVMCRMMVSHKLELILPLVQNDTVIGYFCLGPHRVSNYAARDIQILETISDELVIAIQNAHSVQEVKDLNATLQQRINEATHELRVSNAQLHRLDEAKDEFVGMASHQLRTPLTSVKGYISMVIEGDAGKITDAQKHLLEEAFTSSERMVHLINDFLNVSRLQTGKFIIDKRPSNLAKVVEQEIDSLLTTAASRNLSFSYTPPKRFPILDLDEGKIRQVIMNFADNALYYSAENTTIHVKLTIQDAVVVFSVKDTGIGVPLTEQAELFTKFYRASNARKQRPDGTGVGLFLAKKVIDAHGGKVVFESVEGQGSTFGFHLPLEKLRSVDNAN